MSLTALLVVIAAYIAVYAGMLYLGSKLPDPKEPQAKRPDAAPTATRHRSG
jgi:hypothetical protein